MIKTLTAREKRLLGACIAVLVVSATSLLSKEFLNRRSALDEQIKALKLEKEDNDFWIGQREMLDKQKVWLDENMPVTESMNQANAQLLADLQNEALNRQIKVINPKLQDGVNSPFHREAVVTMKLYGEQAKIMAWLATLQSPEKFYVIKLLELDPDTRSKEPLPQMECDLTIARWFQPETSSTSP